MKKQTRKSCSTVPVSPCPIVGPFFVAKDNFWILAESGALVHALCGSITVAEKGAEVTAQSGSIVIARCGSRVWR